MIAEHTRDARAHDEAEFERRIGRTLWSGPVAVALSNRIGGEIRAVNDAYCDLFGYRRDELIGRTVMNLGFWVDPLERDRVILPATNGAWRPFVEARLRVKGGAVRSVLCSIIQFGDGENDIVATQFYDITERRQTEERLRVLTQIAQLGYEAASVDEILAGALAGVHSLFPAVRVGFGWLEPGHRVRMCASAGPDVMPEQSDLLVEIDRAPAYVAAIMHGDPIAVADVDTDDRVRALDEIWRAYEIGAMLDVPVRRGHETVGILCLDSPVPHHWSVHEITTLQEVAALLAVSIFRARAEEELRTERELLQTMMDNVPDFLYIKDTELRFTRVNRALASFHGRSDPAEFIGKTDFDFYPDRLAQRFHGDEHAVIDSGMARVNELEPQDEAESIWTLTTTVPVTDASGRVVSLVGAARDVSARHYTEAALRTSEARQRALLEAIPDIVFRFDRDGVFLDVRISRSSRFWVPPHTRIGRRLHDILPEHVATPILNAIRVALDTGNVATVEYELHPETDRSAFELRIAPAGDGEVVAIAREITERKLLEERLAHQATHDALTGLPNRALFSVRLDEAIDRIERDETPVAVFFIDLDNFKEVNDRFGHLSGDRLLIAIADRLRRSMRAGDTVARIGGDEFAVLMDEPADHREIETIARRIADRIGHPVRLGRNMARTTASVGIAVGIPAGKRAIDLLAAADHAMYGAKRSGKARHAIIDLGAEPDVSQDEHPATTTPEQGRTPLSLMRRGGIRVRRQRAS